MSSRLSSGSPSACRRPTWRPSRRCWEPCSPTTRPMSASPNSWSRSISPTSIHGRIYQAISRRIEAGQLADAVTLKAEFEHSGVLEEVGGTAYLAQLLSAMVGIINAGEYGRAIHDAWLRRQLIEIGETVVNNAFGAEPELDGQAQVEAAEHSLFELATDGGTSGGFVTFEQGADRGDRGRRARLPPLRPCLRPHHRPARPGREDGRPASVRPGRSSPAGPAWARRRWRPRSPSARPRRLLAEARRLTRTRRRKASVAIFSLEMSAEQLATRLLAEEARVSGDRIRRGDIAQKDFDRFVQVSRAIASPADPDRRHAGDHHVGAADALPAAQADQGAGAGGGGLSAADAPVGRHPAGEPRAGDQPDHAGAEGDRQGAGGAGAGAVAALPCGRKPRGQAAAVVRSARIRAPSSRTPMW